MKYEIYSYDRERILEIGDIIKDGESLGFAFVDDEGRKCAAHSLFVSSVVDKNHKIITQDILE